MNKFEHIWGGATVGLGGGVGLRPGSPHVVGVGGSSVAYHVVPPCGQADMTENITFPQTTCTGGNFQTKVRVLDIR